MKVAILGYGVEGEVSAKYFASQGHTITICDANPEKIVPAGWASQLGERWLRDLDRYDLILRTPSLRPEMIAAANPGVDLTLKMSSGLRYLLAHTEATVIGVTGTKGKGTTTTLIAKMIEATGRKAIVGGNIGASFLGILDEAKSDDVVVLELSSFQLIDADRSPQIAVCLMVVPEHLNWHESFEEYATAKGKIFAHQQPDDLAVYNPANDVSAQLVQLSAGRHVPYGETPGAVISEDSVMIGNEVICRVDEVGLTGPHNLENVCAAVTAVWELLHHDVTAIRNVVTSFTGLEHRLELAGVIDGVKYYDDSFSTTPETAIAAMKSFPGAKVMILGGSDKSSDYAELATEIENHNVIHAFLIGDMASKIATELDTVGFSHYTVVKWQGMDRLVQTASHLVEPGDVVLLSPACASFGLFSDYKDRGNQFKAAVTKLVNV